ncbi:MAG: aspartyl/glutamyl-tRNA amidotransferase subunit C [Oscillospiraceae bacterium]|nr:aspartyl/glutamyl-tRNA amidotransferase subunit C [Oscillospiraceae bacterium]
MINEKIFADLTVLSKFDFTESEQSRFIGDLNAIVDFIGLVKDFDGYYDDTADNNHVTFSDLREDVEISTATPEQLLSNTESENNCYVIPRVLD